MHDYIQSLCALQDGVTPLMVATHNAHSEVVMMLLRDGKANVNWQAKVSINTHTQMKLA